MVYITWNMKTYSNRAHLHHSKAHSGTCFELPRRSLSSSFSLALRVSGVLRRDCLIVCMFCLLPQPRLWENRRQHVNVPSLSGSTRGQTDPLCGRGPWLRHHSGIMRHSGWWVNGQTLDLLWPCLYFSPWGQAGGMVYTNCHNVIGFLWEGDDFHMECFRDMLIHTV